VGANGRHTQDDKEEEPIVQDAHLTVLICYMNLKIMFGRASKGAPAPAIRSVLLNGVGHHDSGYGASGGAKNGFHCEAEPQGSASPFTALPSGGCRDRHEEARVEVGGLWVLGPAGAGYGGRPKEARAEVGPSWCKRRGEKRTRKGKIKKNIGKGNLDFL
jgi:hypothetical protein